MRAERLRGVEDRPPLREAKRSAISLPVCRRRLAVSLEGVAVRKKTPAVSKNRLAVPLKGVAVCKKAPAVSKNRLAVPLKGAAVCKKTPAVSKNRLAVSFRACDISLKPLYICGKDRDISLKSWGNPRKTR